jgi:hypothetical protein
MEIDPATFRLPDRAILDLDFVSYVECGTTPLLLSDLMRSAQLLERQAANPQLTDAMAAVLATALVTEHIRNAEVRAEKPITLSGIYIYRSDVLIYHVFTVLWL